MTDPVLNFLRTVGRVTRITWVGVEGGVGGVGGVEGGGIGVGGVEAGGIGEPHLLLVTERALGRDHEVEETAIYQGTEHVLGALEHDGQDGPVAEVDYGRGGVVTLV